MFQRGDDLAHLEACDQIIPLPPGAGVQIGPGLAPLGILGRQGRAILDLVLAILAVQSFHLAQLILAGIGLADQRRQGLADFRLPPLQSDRIKHVFPLCSIGVCCRPSVR